MVGGKSDQDNPGATQMILVEIALAWLVLSSLSVVLTVALGRAAARGDSRRPRNPGRDSMR